MEKKAIIIDPRDLVTIVAQPVEAGDRCGSLNSAYLQAKGFHENRTQDRIVSYQKGRSG